MKDIKKIKFLGNYYPYVELTVFDYNKVTDRNIKVSTTKLNDEIIKAFSNSDKTISDRAANFDTDFVAFISEKDLLNLPQDKIKDLAERQLSAKI